MYWYRLQIKWDYRGKKKNLEGKVAAPVLRTENTAVGIRRSDHATLSIRKSWH
jgi:hypothetical protein